MESYAVQYQIAWSRQYTRTSGTRSEYIVIKANTKCTICMISQAFVAPTTFPSKPQTPTPRSLSTLTHPSWKHSIFNTDSICIASETLQVSPPPKFHFFHCLVPTCENCLFVCFQIGVKLSIVGRVGVSARWNSTKFLTRG